MIELINPIIKNETFGFVDEPEGKYPQVKIKIVELEFECDYNVSDYSECKQLRVVFDKCHLWLTVGDIDWESEINGTFIMDIDVINFLPDSLVFEVKFSCVVDA